MPEPSDWMFPENLQPRADALRFDLDMALDSVVMLRAEVPDDAFTASILGTERIGNGVVIRHDGLILTIGYLVTEAERIWLTTNDGKVVPGYPLAYDFVTGFALVQPLGKLAAPAIARGSSAACGPGDDVIVIGHGGLAHTLAAKLLVKREFAGYWEYVLDEALFTAPAHPHWGGTALVAQDGKLIGIGSLLVQEPTDEQPVQGNMFVPIDLLDPILDDLLRQGQAARPPRPWLGMYTTEAQGQLIVAGVADGGPADRAGIRQGDVVQEVGGAKPASLADFFRKVWRLGQAGVEVPLTLVRKGAPIRLRVESADRGAFLKKPRLH
jgi:S1-C subfamily serine protease